MRKAVMYLGLALPIALMASPSSAADWKPDRTVSLFVGSTAGGANDRQARLLQVALGQCCLDGVTINVVNKPGAEQNLAVQEVKSHSGDPLYLALFSTTWIGGQVAQGADNLLDGLTPVMRLWSNYQILAVKADSEIKNMADVKARMAKDPASVSFAVAPGGGSPGQLALIKMGELLVGAKPEQMRIVSFDGAKEAVAQAAGGHVDVVISSIGTAKPLVGGGQLRMIGLLAPERIDSADMANVPTLKEQGVDLEASYTFGLLAPAGITDDQKAFWVAALNKAATLDVVKEGVARDDLAGHPSADGVGDWISKSAAEMKQGLTELGLVQKH